MKNFTEVIERIRIQSDAVQADLISFLETIVNKESGSYDTEDVNALGDFLQAICQGMGAQITRPKSSVHGDPIACTFNCGEDPDARRVLLVCHRDTVFPHGTAEIRPFTQDEQKGYGPGCADMKGGIDIGIHAIKVLNSMKDIIAPIPIEIIFTSDEEIGSEASSGFVKERAKNAKVAFFLEPARASGALVIGRDGGDIFEIEAYGRSSHAGNAFEEGVSAVHGLARVIGRMSELSDAKAGYSTNIGLVDGGDGAIIVADHACCKGYTRFSTLEQREFLRENFRKICAEESQKGLKIEMKDPVGFLPFLTNEKNQMLFSLVCEAGRLFDLNLDGLHVRGAADAGITSTEGVPTICGMGPVGANLHTDREWVLKASLSERLKVLTAAILLANEKFQ